MWSSRAQLRSFLTTQLRPSRRATRPRPTPTMLTRRSSTLSDPTGRRPLSSTTRSPTTTAESAASIRTQLYRREMTQFSTTGNTKLGTRAQKRRSNPEGSMAVSTIMFKMKGPLLISSFKAARRRDYNSSSMDKDMCSPKSISEAA